MTIKISLLSIESDNADPAIMAAISALLERAGVRSAVVVSAPETETPAPAREMKRARARCSLFPPCKPCRDDDGVCDARVRKAAVEHEPKATPVPTKPAGEPVIDGEFPEVDEPEPTAPSTTTEPATPLRVQVGPKDKMPVADPGGRVQGVEPPPVAKGSDTERIVELVHARPGITVHELAREICGVCNGGTVRRIDMLVGPLTMSGKLARFNGRLYRDTKQAGELKLPPPQRGADLPRRPGTGQAPLAKVDDTKAFYDKIVAAFAKDNECSLPRLAIEVFGDSSGKSYQKVQLMCRQLVASERLEHLGGLNYRPIGDKERRGRADEEDEREDGDSESSGAPDDDETEELDLS